ncbi:very short patch repair endonuclease [Mesorhizobium sp. 2RAF45]|uniref:very short patch repair endonuclease n=1 Tax=Mesorhizobium sp. 2RAF45 TaxID=3233001 RepID=UPI003F96A3CC
MPDHVSPERRSYIMSQVGTRNTKPELMVRQALHRLGYRFRLHRRDLPGSPDLVFPARRKVIFVHGCFWHGHNCRWGHLPKSRPDYWQPKIEANRERDLRNLAALGEAGWLSHVIWQCALRDPDTSLEKAVAFLDGYGSVGEGRETDLATT